MPTTWAAMMKVRRILLQRVWDRECMGLLFFLGDDDVVGDFSDD